MTDPRDIAEKLSEAQRDWLIATEPTLDRVPKVPCAEWWDNPDSLYVEIDEQDFWLAARSMTSPAGSPDFTDAWEQLTPLGLAVRAHLTGAPK